MNDRPIEAAQTSADMRCPDCLGSEFPGFKRGVRCATCKGTATRPTPAAAAGAITKEQALKALERVASQYHHLDPKGILRQFIEQSAAAAGVPPSDVLIEAAQAYRDAQDALDNREYAGINGEPYEVLMRRRNAARDDLDTALASAMLAASGAPAGAPSDQKEGSVHQAVSTSSVPDGVHSGEAPASAPLAGGSAQ